MFVVRSKFLWKLLSLFFVSIIVNLILQCEGLANGNDNSQSGNVKLVYEDVIDSESLRRSIECYPTEIYYGDTVYVAEYLENLSDKDMRDYYPSRSAAWEKGCYIEVTSSQVGGSFRWRYENPTGRFDDYLLPSFLMKPSEKYCFDRYSVEFCPLHYYDHPFWKELREKMKPEGIVCTLTVKGFLGKDWLGAKPFSCSQDILVKPRPDKETELLEKWYNNTPQDFLPKNEGASRVRHNEKNRADVRFSPDALKFYDPWLFIRVGNRKPSVPNNPRTLEGWRELETSLVPSTMRDEIRLTRLRMEYFAAKSEIAAETAKKEYSQWLASLPAPQRLVMSSYDYFSLASQSNGKSPIEAISELEFGKRYLKLEEERFNDLAQGYENSRLEVEERLKNDPEGKLIPKDTRIISRVVIFGVGGGGTFFSQAETPNLETIFKDSSVNSHVLTSTPTRNAECWASMLHGVTPKFHERTDDVVQSTPYPADSPFPSVFRVIRENRPDANLASFCSWNPINTGIVEENIGVVKGTAESDADLTELVCDYVEQNEPTLLFVQFDECDQVGRSHGYGSPEFLLEIAKTDGYIRKIYDVFENRGLLDSTLFILTADHGGTGTTCGGMSNEEKYVLVAATGPEIRTLGMMEDIRDMAAIILAALGLADKQPEGWTSCVPRYFLRAPKEFPEERPVYSIPYAYEHRTSDETVCPPFNAPAVCNVMDAQRVVLFLSFHDGFDGYRGIGLPNLFNGDTSRKPRRNGSPDFVRRGSITSGAQLDRGWLSYVTPESDKDVFSMATWFKTDYIGGEPCLISNQSWDAASSAGFALTLRPPFLKFKVGSEDNCRTLHEFNLPADYRDGWVYVVMVVDRKNSVIRLSFDFEDFTTVDLGAELDGVDLALFPSISIGREKSSDRVNFGFLLDEFLVFDGELTHEDLKKLKKLYCPPCDPEMKGDANDEE